MKLNQELRHLLCHGVAGQVVGEVVREDGALAMLARALTAPRVPWPHSWKPRCIGRKPLSLGRSAGDKGLRPMTAVRRPRGSPMPPRCTSQCRGGRRGCGLCSRAALPAAAPQERGGSWAVGAASPPVRLPAGGRWGDLPPHTVPKRPRTHQRFPGGRVWNGRASHHPTTLLPPGAEVGWAARLLTRLSGSTAGLVRLRRKKLPPVSGWTGEVCGWQAPPALFESRPTW